MKHSCSFFRPFFRPLRAALLLAGLALASTSAAQAQSVGVGTPTPNPKAALDISATDKGLLIPRLTTAQRTAIASPPNGLMVFQTDGTAGFWYYFGGAWLNIPNAATAGDNLGNHTATQNLNLGPNQLVGNGGSSGLSISNGGQVGLGTTTPAARLDIQAGADGNGAGDPGGVAFQYRAGGFRHWLRSRHNSSVSGDGNDLDFYLNNATTASGSTAAGTGNIQVLTLENNNSQPRVGIGTTAPTQALEVAGEIFSSTGGVRFPDNTVQTTAAVAPTPQTTATNGLTSSGGSVALGGTLTQPTAINQRGHQLLLTYLNANALITDQDFLTPPSGNGLAMNDVWQTFTAGVTSDLREVTLAAWGFGGVTTPATLSIYAGTGTNSPALGTASVALSPTAGTQATATLTTPIALVAGQVYTLHLTRPVQNFAWFTSFTGGYAGGQASFNASYDLAFRTRVSSPGTVAAFDGAAGRVGIGTAAPTQALEVAGQIFSSTGGVRFPDNTVQTTAAVVPAPQTLSKTGSAISLSGGGSSVTDADDQQLSITGSTISLSNGGGSVTVPSSADNLGNHTATTNLGLNGNWLSNAPANANGLRIDNTGRVGVNVPAPTQALEVAGQVFSNTGGFRFPDHTVQTTAATTTASNGLTATGNNVALGGPLTAATTIAQGSNALGFTGTGGVGIGTASPAASAQLEVASTTKGFLPPRLSQTQRDAIGSPATGLQVFNTTSGKLNVWDGTAWTAPLTTAEQPYQGPDVAFSFTGGVQTYTVPAGVISLRVAARGAQGGRQVSGGFGGQGGLTLATLAVTPGEVLTIVVGGAGSTASGSGSADGAGYNGGGNGRFGNGGGGGASDVRRGGTALTNRVVVAAGGGGGTFFTNGGEGGGLTGNTGLGGFPGLGGTQSAGGAGGAGVGDGTLGQGGTGNFSGGGGGYYGGGGGGGSNGSTGGGGGGSSFVTATGSSAITFITGDRAGNGLVILTPVTYAAPVLDGSNIVGLPAANLTGGPLPALNANALTNLNAANLTGGPLPALNASALTNFNASNLTTGTVAPARLGLTPQAGGIVFTDATSLRQNSTALNWDNTNTRLGVGTGSPAARLDIQGGANADGSGDPRALAFQYQTGGFRHWVRSRHNDITSAGGNGLDFFVNNATTAAGSSAPGTGNVQVLTLENNAGQPRVGIGTTDPIARLHVNGGPLAAPVGTLYTFFNQTSPALIQASGAAAGRPLAAYFTGGQVWVNDAIVAGAMQTTSDARIKRVVGLSDRTADLALLNRLRITDYRYIDQISNSNQVVKKIIAQEVEEVLPTAVSRSTQALPNVYEKATAVRYANGYVTVTMAKAHGLPAAGGRMRFYTPANVALDPAVTVVDAHTVRFASAEAHAAGLFVYGKYVDDFRSVDYDALTTLNVSATQELARKVEALETRNTALETRNAALQVQLRQQASQAEATFSTFEARLRALEANTGGQARR